MPLQSTELLEKRRTLPSIVPEDVGKHVLSYYVRQLRKSQREDIVAILKQIEPGEIGKRAQGIYAINMNARHLLRCFDEVRDTFKEYLQGGITVDRHEVFSDKSIVEAFMVWFSCRYIYAYLRHTEGVHLYVAKLLPALEDVHSSLRTYVSSLRDHNDSAELPQSFEDFWEGLLDTLEPHALPPELRSHQPYRHATMDGEISASMMARQ